MWNVPTSLRATQLLDPELGEQIDDDMKGYLESRELCNYTPYTWDIKVAIEELKGNKK